MSRRNHNGLAVVKLILVVVVLTVIGGTGWFVYHSKQAASKNNGDNLYEDTSGAQVKTYADCKKVIGSIMQETYPEVCVTKGGQRFVDPSQSVKAP